MKAQSAWLKHLKHDNCKLNSSNLSVSNIADEGAKHLAEALKHGNCKLNRLNLSRCYITDEGAKHLAEALMHSECKLNILHMFQSKITEKGKHHLAKALTDRNTERKTDLTHNYEGEIHLVQLACLETA